MPFRPSRAARGWLVGLLAAGPLFCGCAKSSQETAAPSVAPAAPVAQPAPAASAAPPGAGAPSTAGVPEEHEAQKKAPAPSSLTTKNEDLRGFSSGERFDTLADAEAVLEKENQKLTELYAHPVDKTKTGAVTANREQTNAADRCALACKAFASLKRAAAAVCRLAGEHDARCAHAKHLVDVNQRRVASCHCPKSP